jgi:hypothetical protein
VNARPVIRLKARPEALAPTPAAATVPKAPSEAKWREAWIARNERLRSRFWVVWCPTELRPQRRQESREAALAEAKRLHALFPAKEFLTYECALVTEAPPVRPSNI